VYRAEVSFGHPLFAGAFLSIPAVLGLADWLDTGRRRSVVLGLISALGVVMTVSRGSILAVGVASVFAVLAAFLMNRTGGVPRAIGVVGIGLVAVAGLSGFSPLAERDSSVESELSAGVRQTAFDVALRAAHDSGWLGSGPWTSGIAGRLLQDVVIENSMLQLLISVGLPGLLLFLAVFGAAAVESLRRRDIGGAAIILAYLIAITSFNSIDAVRSMHAVLGLLLLLALNGAGGIPRSPDAGLAASAKRVPVPPLATAAELR
jgi:O-antigen ligase